MWAHFHLWHSATGNSSTDSLPQALLQSTERHSRRSINLCVLWPSLAAILGQVGGELALDSKPHPAGGASARPFETTATEFTNRKLSLRIAPELWLKRLIIGGIDQHLVCVCQRRYQDHKFVELTSMPRHN